MSKKRSVSTAIWSDPFIEGLSPEGKLLYLYLITNEKSNMIGIFELTNRKMKFDTCIEDVESLLGAFEKANKLVRQGSYVILKNFIKHQNYNTNMKKSAIDTFNNLPNGLRKGLVLNKNKPQVEFDKLCEFMNAPQPKSKPIKANDEIITKDDNSNFKKWNEQDLLSDIETHRKDYDKELLNAFYIYWSEKNNKGKMRMQLQSTWSTPGRLAFWKKRENDFTKNKGGKKEVIINAANALMMKLEAETIK